MEKHHGVKQALFARWPKPKVWSKKVDLCLTLVVFGLFLVLSEKLLHLSQVGVFLGP